MKKLANPRGYLSWTQIDMWLRNPEHYVRKYMFGEDMDMGGALMDYGKKTATALETGKETGDELLDLLVATLPKYPTKEHEIRAKLATPYGEVELLGKLDTFHPKTLDFREYKTGRTPWTDKRAQGHRQLYHYQTLIWLKHGKLAQKVHLDWAETEYAADGQICFTGNIRTFPVKIGLAEVLEYMTLASRVAKEIDQRYRQERKKLI